jgi:formylglycine-generating enzyme required for sulfatase activity
LCGDSRRCESLIRDICGDKTKEAHLLIQALKQQVPMDLIGMHPGTAPLPTLQRLQQRLQDSVGLAELTAGWAVNAWALALGIITKSEGGFVERVEPQPRSERRPPVEPPAEELEELLAHVSRVHAEAKRLAEKEQDYAGAARLIEALPEQHRRKKLYAEICRRRDRVAELQTKVGDAVRSLRLSGLRPLVEEWLKLQPRRRRELQPLLDRLPVEPKRPQAGLVITNWLGMNFIFVPSGTFWMGDRGNQTQMQISHDFYMGDSPIKQGQWQAIMGRNPSYFSRSGEGASKVKGFSDADLTHFPVEQVSWDDVQEFLQRLNEKEKKSGFLYRLPTEAEWEYSCRGGVTSQQDCAFDFYFAQPTNDLSSDQANFHGNYPTSSARKSHYLERTTKVGSYKPNRLGIYDMHGNIWEWCEDHFEPGGSTRVIRGGGWINDGSTCRASFRRNCLPGIRANFVGVRLVLLL